MAAGLRRRAATPDILTKRSAAKCRGHLLRSAWAISPTTLALTLLIGSYPALASASPGATSEPPTDPSSSVTNAPVPRSEHTWNAGVGLGIVSFGLYALGPLRGVPVSGLGPGQPGAPLTLLVERRLSEDWWLAFTAEAKANRQRSSEGAESSALGVGLHRTQGPNYTLESGTSYESSVDGAFARFAAGTAAAYHFAPNLALRLSAQMLSANWYRTWWQDTSDDGLVSSAHDEGLGAYASFEPSLELRMAF